MKLCLGTVQLGMEYGIAKDSKPDNNEASAILEYAFSHGINTFDTASSYGNAENIVGSFLQTHRNDRKSLHIISKTDANCLENISKQNYVSKLKENLSKSLTRLCTDYIDSYLFHTASYAYDNAKLEALFQLKQEGLTKHCGISVYYPDEARSAIQSGFIDFIQLPFNLFDHRFYNEGIFALAKEKNVIIHTRSTFLQGLFAMNVSQLPPFLKKAQTPLNKLEEFCQINSLNKLELAMAFVKSFSELQGILIGVNTIEQLKNNITTYNTNISENITKNILQVFQNVDQRIFLPTLWNK